MKTLIVLGAAVWPNGPSPTLLRRCTHAADVWHAGGYEAIIVCGGLGKHAPTEAEAMAQILLTENVPASAIHLEDQSTTTFENLSFAQPIITRLGTTSMTIVTDGYHGPRARLIAKVLGFEARTSAPSNRGAHLKTQIKMHLREAFALPVYAIKLIVMRKRKQL